MSTKLVDRPIYKALLSESVFLFARSQFKSQLGEKHDKTDNRKPPYPFSWPLPKRTICKLKKSSPRRESQAAPPPFWLVGMCRFNPWVSLTAEYKEIFAILFTKACGLGASPCFNMKLIPVYNTTGATSTSQRAARDHVMSMHIILI